MHKTNTIYHILVVIMLAMLPMTGIAQAKSTPENKPTRARVDKAAQDKAKEEKDSKKAKKEAEEKAKKEAEKKEKEQKAKEQKAKEEAEKKAKEEKAKKEAAEKAKKEAEAKKAKEEAEKKAKQVPAKPKAEEPKIEPAKQERAKDEDEEAKTETRQYDGLDVSKYQKTIDWDAVKKNPKIKYVYIKATEGCNHTDPRYEENIRKAREAGVKVGSYHFLTCKSSATAQFENYRMAARKEEQDLLPMLDVEVCDKWTAQQLRDSVKVFADLVEEYYGVKPLIYTGEHFFNNRLGLAFADYPIFIAKYSKNVPKINGVKWIIWQFADNGRVNGIPARVDLSCFNKGCSIEDLLYKPAKTKRGGNVKGSVSQKDKPDQVKLKEKPAPSKREQEEAKKQAEKDRKAKERAQKMKEDEAKKKAEEERKAKEKADKKAKQEAEQKAKKAAEAKQEAVRKAKEEQAKKEAEEKARQEAEAKKAADAKQAKKDSAKKAKEEKAQRQATMQRQQAEQRASSIKSNKSSMLNQSQRNDSIRSAQQQGQKINKSSADND